MHLPTIIATTALLVSLIACVLIAGQNETIADMKAQLDYHSHSHWYNRGLRDVD